MIRPFNFLKDDVTLRFPEFTLRVCIQLCDASGDIAERSQRFIASISRTVSIGAIFGSRRQPARFSCGRFRRESLSSRFRGATAFRRATNFRIMLNLDNETRSSTVCPAERRILDAEFPPRRWLSDDMSRDRRPEVMMDSETLRELTRPRPRPRGSSEKKYTF